MDNDGHEMKSTPEVALVRHGQTEWSKTARHTGRTDIPLTDLGRKQARALGRMIEDDQFDQVLSSPLSRAWETMELAGLVGQAVASSDLVEWDYGEYEGLPTVEIRLDHPGWTVWTHPIIGGESIEDVSVRADLIISSLLESEGSTVLFAHAHILRILAARWMGLSPEAGAALSLDTATLSTLGWERENRVIRTWNVMCPIHSGDSFL
jgi:probable phosphoglycerate mutase